MAYLAVVGGGGGGIGRVAAERAGGGRRIWKKDLTFRLTVWARRDFPLRWSPRAPPSASGSACERRAQKRAEPVEFGVLVARLSRFFVADANKPPGEAVLGARLEML